MEKISTVYVTSIKDFFDFLESFKNFSAQAYEIVQKEIFTPDSEFQETFQRIHSWLETIFPKAEHFLSRCEEELLLGSLYLPPSSLPEPIETMSDNSLDKNPVIAKEQESNNRRFEVQIDSRGGHDGAATGGLYGYSAVVIASRHEIIKHVEIIKNEEVIRGQLTYKHYDWKAIIELSDEFDEEKDYLIVEKRYQGNPFLGHRNRRSYQLLAGKMPQWAIFPEAWRTFVYDSEVKDSAIEYIQQKARQKGEKTLELVRYAQRKSAKNTIHSAWEEVAKAFGLTHLKFGYTWTAVSAMPIKIATALGWKPPKPRPQWAKRDGVIIAKP